LPVNLAQDAGACHHTVGHKPLNRLLVRSPTTELDTQRSRGATVWRACSERSRTYLWQVVEASDDAS